MSMKSKENIFGMNFAGGIYLKLIVSVVDIEMFTAESHISSTNSSEMRKPEEEQLNK